MISMPENMPPGEPGKVKGLWATRGIVLVAFLDLFMQFPVIAPYARSLGASGAMVGIIVAIYSASNLVGNVAAGAVLDRWGRKRPLLIGLLATSLALLFYALARTPRQLMLTRGFHGLTASVLTPGAFAIMGDSTSTDQRARAMGLSGAFIAVAAMIGPLIAGVMRDNHGAGAVFLLSSALMLCTFLFFFFVAAKWISPPGEKSGRTAPERSQAFWRIPRLITSYLAALALTIGLGTLVTHLPIIMSERGESATRTGLTFTVFAGVAMAAMATPVNRLSDRHGRLAPMVAGLLLVAAGMAVLWVSRGFTGSVLGMGVFGLGFGIIFPAVTALTAEAVQWSSRGKAFGVFYAVFSLGVVIGAVVSGTFTQHLGQSTVMPYFFSGLVALAASPAITLVWRLCKGTRAE